jgi:predicted Rossmann fold nucleotide-binding protein DprA/Smf involved in DNA uptake
LTCATDVLEPLGLEPLPPEPIDLGDNARAVLVALAQEPAGADELGRATGLDAGALATALSELELAGAVAEADGLFRGVRTEG